MDYYESKQEAIRTIDEMWHRGNSELQISFKINTVYGFGRNMVRRRLALLEEMQDVALGNTPGSKSDEALAISPRGKSKKSTGSGGHLPLVKNSYHQGTEEKR